MGILHIWWLRAGYPKWLIIIIWLGDSIWAIIWDWILGDTIEYIRSQLGVDMNIIEAILSKPFTVIALVSLICIIIWIWRVGNKDSALRELHNKLLTIRDIDKKAVVNAVPEILAKHNKETNDEIWLLVAQGLSKNRKRKKSDITIEELDSMRMQRLIPENAELEEMKRQNKKLRKLWESASILQTAILDDILDKRVARFKRMIILSDSFYVYKEVISKLKILKFEDYQLLIKPVKITRDALDEAHDMVNKRISLLLHNKDTVKEERLVKEVRK